MAFLNFPIETDEAKKFWASRSKVNRCLAIIAFSLDEDNAIQNLRRVGGYPYIFRRYHAWNNLGCWVNQPDMKNVPFHDISSELWWEVMPYSENPQCWIGGTNHIPGSNPPNVSPSVTPVITKQPVATFSTTSGGTITLSVTATSTAGTLSYQWYKDNSAILGQKSDTLTINNATIGQSGNYSVRVTNTESGKRPITVTSNTSNVTVTQAVIEATGITISGPTGGLAIGTTRPLTVTLTPTGAVAIVTWYSSDQLIATVSTTGVVTALKKGSAVISATITKSDGTVVTSNNYNLSVVDAQATGMSFTRTTETITSGNTTTIAYTFVPQGSTGTIVLSSSNDNVAKATLDSTGKIITLEGVSAGTATISATVNGYQSSNSVAVTVEQKQSTMPDYDRTIKYDINVQAGQPIDIVIPMKNQSVMGTVTYKWVKDDGSANGVDTGITTQNFHIDNATLAEAGVYYCWVTNTDAGASPTTITTPKATVVVSATVIPDASWVADMPTTLDAGTDFDIEWQDGVGPFEVREIRTSDTPEHLVNNSTQAGRTYKFETFGDRYNQAYKKAGTYRVDIVDKGVTPNKTLQSRITSLHDYHINLVKSSGDGTLAAYNPATYNQALEIDEGKTIELTVQKIDELTNTAVASGGNNFKILLAGDSSIATGTIKASDTNKRTLVIAGVKAGTTTYSLTTSDMKGDSDLVITVKSTAPVEPKVASVQIAKRFDVLRSDAAAPYNTNIINPAAPIRALDASGNVVDASKYTVKWELDGTTAGADISPDGKLTWTPGTDDPNVDVKVTVTNNSDSSTVTATGTLVTWLADFSVSGFPSGELHPTQVYQLSYNFVTTGVDKCDFKYHFEDASGKAEADIAAPMQPVITIIDVLSSDHTARDADLHEDGDINKPLAFSITPTGLLTVSDKAVVGNSGTLMFTMTYGENPAWIDTDTNHVNIVAKP